MIVEPDALINAKANPDFWETVSSSAYTRAAAILYCANRHESLARMQRNSAALVWLHTAVRR